MTMVGAYRGVPGKGRDAGVVRIEIQNGIQRSKNHID